VLRLHDASPWCPEWTIADERAYFEELERRSSESVYDSSIRVMPVRRTLDKRKEMQIAARKGRYKRFNEYHGKTCFKMSYLDLLEISLLPEETPMRVRFKKKCRGWKERTLPTLPNIPPVKSYNPFDLLENDITVDDAFYQDVDESVAQDWLDHIDRCESKQAQKYLRSKKVLTYTTQMPFQLDTRYRQPGPSRWFLKEDLFDHQVNKDPINKFEENRNRYVSTLNILEQKRQRRHKFPAKLLKEKEDLEQSFNHFFEHATAPTFLIKGKFGGISYDPRRHRPYYDDSEGTRKWHFQREAHARSTFLSRLDPEGSIFWIDDRKFISKHYQGV
jgi:hypothetical protein